MTTERIHVEWRTDDHLLAAWLMMNVDFLGTEWDEDTCVWLFPNNNETYNLVKKYDEGQAVADLKEYNEKVADLKSQMYEELDRRRGRVRSRRRG